MLNEIKMSRRRKRSSIKKLSEGRKTKADGTRFEAERSEDEDEREEGGEEDICKCKGTRPMSVSAPESLIGEDETSSDKTRRLTMLGPSLLPSPGAGANELATEILALPC
mmetsp:Transcript_7992/g.26773  ORF Transcript_7992/g.26773 Transcript_7992/m.26773 type:complete len:110 (+) Transcript_7992:73-402(+)